MIEEEDPRVERIDAMASRTIECPYCGEEVELVLEADTSGELVIDCEVCCNPWRVRIAPGRSAAGVDVSRLDD